MICANDDCIYNEQKKCVLTQISLNNIGMCEDCIMPSYPQEIIDKYKKQTFDELEKG